MYSRTPTRVEVSLSRVLAGHRERVLSERAFSRPRLHLHQRGANVLYRQGWKWEHAVPGILSGVWLSHRGQSGGMADLRAVYAGSLDDPSGLEPLAETWTSSAQPWDYLHPALPQYEHQPTEAQMQALMAARS